MPQLDYAAIFSTIFAIALINVLAYFLIIAMLIPSYFNAQLCKFFLLQCMVDNNEINTVIASELDNIIEGYLLVNYES